MGISGGFDRQCLKKEILMNTKIKLILLNETPFEIDLSEEELDWELEEIDEREMGVERLYEATIEKDVDCLDEPLKITLRVWEYPEGIVNMQEIEPSIGEVVEECDLGQFVISYYEDEEDES